MSINMLLGGSVSFLLSIVDQLQIIVHLPILNLQIPSNGMEFFSISVPIVTYDLLENIEVYNDFLDLLTRSEKKGKKKKLRRLSESKE